MREWPQYYILVGRMPVAVDVLTWGRWFGASRDRYIAQDHIGKVFISTVFLGLDHNYHTRMGEPGDPLLFETMVFGGPLDQEQWRYATYDQAERGHADAIVQVKKAAAQIKAIADSTGIKEK